MIVWRLQPLPSAWWALVASGENIHDGSSSFGLTILLSAAIQCFVAPQTRAGDLSCSGLIGGGPTVSPIDGNVTVPDGKSCTLSLVNITGNVGVGSDATLTVLAYTEPSSIGGDIEAKNCKGGWACRQFDVGGNLNSDPDAPIVAVSAAAALYRKCIGHRRCARREQPGGFG
jgi:hypothetical protein